jgi:hypothetical protein
VKQKGVLFCLTANDCRLDPDLSTRSLPVKLFREDCGPMDPYVRDYALEHREEIYGEILGLALEAQGEELGGKWPQFRFRAWLEFVYPRISGRFGELAIEEARELDDKFQDLFTYGYDHPRESFTAAALLDGLLGKYDSNQNRLYSALAYHLLSLGSKRAQKSALGRFLREQAGQSHSPRPGVAVRLERLSDSSKKSAAKYIFHVEGDDEVEGDDGTEE